MRKLTNAPKMQQGVMSTLGVPNSITVKKGVVSRAVPGPRMPSAGAGNPASMLRGPATMGKSGGIVMAKS